VCQWANQGARFFLVARNADRLQQVADDLTARGAQPVLCQQMDIDQLGEHAAMMQRCAAELGALDIVLVAPGALPDLYAVVLVGHHADHPLNSRPCDQAAFAVMRGTPRGGGWSIFLS
jgi:NAD(P)-dependent dehydrogenase (short-subunit alcohol dehydrogenase family)